MSYPGKSLTSALLLGVGLLMAAIAAWQFYMFVMFRDSQGDLNAQGGGLNLWLAIAAAGVACVCVCSGIFRRINKTEEFHINS